MDFVIEARPKNQRLRSAVSGKEVVISLMRRIMAAHRQCVSSTITKKIRYDTFEESLRISGLKMLADRTEKNCRNIEHVSGQDSVEQAT